MEITLDILRRNILDSISAKQSLLKQEENLNIFNNAVKVIVERYQNDGRVYIAGNGGSAADAQHLAAEFVSKLSKDRDPLPAEALTVDSSVITAIGNDYGFDNIFSRQLKGKLTNKDVFLAITTSGNSLNIVNAIEECNKMKIPTIVFSGNTGGKVKHIADYCIIVPGNRTSIIQELHIVLAHTLCECVEKELFRV